VKLFEVTACCLLAVTPCSLVGMYQSFWGTSIFTRDVAEDFSLNIHRRENKIWHPSLFCRSQNYKPICYITEATLRRSHWLNGTQPRVGVCEANCLRTESYFLCRYHWFCPRYLAFQFMFSFPFTFIPFLSYHPASWVERALGTGHLSPRGFHEADLEGGLLYWGPRKIC